MIKSKKTGNPITARSLGEGDEVIRRGGEIIGNIGKKIGNIFR